jgi:hypothetical protein
MQSVVWPKAEPLSIYGGFEVRSELRARLPQLHRVSQPKQQVGTYPVSPCKELAPLALEQLYTNVHKEGARDGASFLECGERGAQEGERGAARSIHLRRA